MLRRSMVADGGTSGEGRVGLVDATRALCYLYRRRMGEQAMCDGETKATSIFDPFKEVRQITMGCPSAYARSVGNATVR